MYFKNLFEYTKRLYEIPIRSIATNQITCFNICALKNITMAEGEQKLIDCKFHVKLADEIGCFLQKLLLFVPYEEWSFLNVQDIRYYSAKLYVGKNIG